MTPLDLLLLIVLASLWGSSFLFIRVAVPALGPFALPDSRVLIAALTLILYALAVRRPLELRGRMGRFVLLGALNAGIPFALIAWAELHITASLAAILNSTAPLWGAVVAAVWLKDRITLRRGLGLLMGVAGVAVVVGWSPLELTPLTLLAVGAMLTASLFYGIGSSYASRYFQGVPVLTMAIGQPLGAGLALLPLAALNPPPAVPPTSALLSVLALGVLCTALAYLIYFRLLDRVGPTSTLSVTYLVPIFGLLYGHLFLDEPIGIGLIVGLAIVLTSVTLVTKMQLPGPVQRLLHRRA